MRCESVTLRTHWVLVVMDHYTRRIIGFGIQAGVVDGMALCRMFKQAIRGVAMLPKYFSSDHDPLYRFHQWQANLRILDVRDIKTVPYVPLSHPFIGAFDRYNPTRVFGPVAILDGTTDLEMKLIGFKDYFNTHRSHAALKGQTPIETPESRGVDFKSYRWQKHCRGLYQTPIAA